MTTPTKPETVWVMTFQLRDGHDTDEPFVTLHHTEAGAKESLRLCVAQYWEGSMGEDVEMPEDDDEAVDAFFDEVSCTCNVIEQAIIP